MNIIYILIPVAIIIVAIAIVAFFWAVKNNQFDDLERHGTSILFDDDVKSTPVKNHSSQADISEKSTQDEKPSAKSTDT